MESARSLKVTPATVTGVLTSVAAAAPASPAAEGSLLSLQEIHPASTTTHTTTHIHLDFVMYLLFYKASQ